MDLRRNSFLSAEERSKFIQQDSNLQNSPGWALRGPISRLATQLIRLPVSTGNNPHSALTLKKQAPFLLLYSIPADIGLTFQ